MILTRMLLIHVMCSLHPTSKFHMKYKLTGFIPEEIKLDYILRSDEEETNSVNIPISSKFCT